MTSRAGMLKGILCAEPFPALQEPGKGVPRGRHFLRLLVARFQSIARGYFVSLGRSCGSACSSGTFRHCLRASWACQSARLQCVRDGQKPGAPSRPALARRRSLRRGTPPSTIHQVRPSSSSELSREAGRICRKRSLPRCRGHVRVSGIALWSASFRHTPSPKSWGQLGAKTRARTGQKQDVRGVRSADSTGLWRKRVGVEPTTLAAKDRINGFEGHEGHRTPFASADIVAQKSAGGRRFVLVPPNAYARGTCLPPSTVSLG